MRSRQQGVVVGEGVEGDRDQGPDVLDIDDLGMEDGDGEDLECVNSVREEGRLRWSRELPLGGDEVALEGIRDSLL
jgi:hypothetical protein